MGCLKYKSLETIIGKGVSQKTLDVCILLIYVVRCRPIWGCEAWKRYRNE